MSCATCEYTVIRWRVLEARINRTLNEAWDSCFTFFHKTTNWSINLCYYEKYSNLYELLGLHLDEKSIISVLDSLKCVQYLLLWRQAKPGKQKLGLYSALVYCMDSSERSVWLYSGYALNYSDSAQLHFRNVGHFGSNQFCFPVGFGAFQDDS